MIRLPARIRHFRELAQASYWFLPTVMTSISAVLALGALAYDRRVDERSGSAVNWVYQGTAEGARWVLSTVAGSMVTVAGVSFSITILVLSLASSQFGPRLLRSFLRDTGNEFVLGTFISTFLYCLLVLQGVRGAESDTFIPHLAVTIAILLAAFSLGVLIYFIHHVASMIQVENVIAGAGLEAEKTIAELFPQRIGRGGVEAPYPAGPAIEVASEQTGYVESLDGVGLLQLARKHDVVIELIARPGRFVKKADPLAVVHGNVPAARLARQVRRSFFVGRARTPLHDVNAAVTQLVEIGVRALSSATNDPFTAIVCVDYLSSVLCLLARAEEVSGFRYDADGRLRLVTTPARTASVIVGALDSIRRYARAYPEVSFRLLGAIEAVGACAQSDELRDMLRDAAATLRSEAGAIVGETDRARVVERADEVLAV